MARGELSVRTVAALLVVTSLALAGAVGVVTADKHKDGNHGNGEEVRSASNEEDPHFDGNYTYRPDNHQPGAKDGAVEHYSFGFTENVTLHWIQVRSPDFNFADCTPSDTRAFGIDRGNDDPGTQTDESLLTSYKTASFTENAIEIGYYKEEKIAGSPMNITIYDQIVARQENCYDNPDEPGWYRVRGRINASSNGDTKTDYVLLDYSQWVYVCDCQNRQEAEKKLGPSPAETDVAYNARNVDSGGGGDGASDGGDGASDGGDGTDGGASTPTATPAPTGGDGTSTATASATPASDENPASSPGTQTGTPGQGDGGTNTATAGDGTATQSGPDDGGDGPNTPTGGSGPGFGVAVALVSLAAAVATATRVDR